MKNILILLSLLFLSFQSANSQWTMQSSGTTNNIKDIEFINRNTGWACADGTILKTTNGGMNWVIQPQPSNSLIQGIHPVDSMVVYAAGWFNTILKTTNGGENWTSLRNGTPPDQPSFDGVFFINKDTGWICGDVVMFKTTDGGITYDSMRIEGVLFDIFFKNKNEGLTCGQFGSFYKTIDGGLSWDKIQVLTGSTQYSFYRMTFVGDIGWLVGGGGGGPIYKTTDFGYTWDSIGNVMSQNDMYPVEFVNENTGWAGGASGVIYKTTDGGLSWVQQVTSTQFNSGLIRSIYAFNDSLVWAVGNVGKILHTTNGGVSTILQSGNEIPDDFTLEQNYPNPFNSSTNIKFLIRQKGFIILEIFDYLGRSIDLMEYGIREPGSYTINYNAEKLSSGVYFYRLHGGVKSITKQFTLVK